MGFQEVSAPSAEYVHVSVFKKGQSARSVLCLTANDIQYLREQLWEASMGLLQKDDRCVRDETVLVRVTI